MKKYWVGRISTKKLILSVLVDLNLHGEVMIEAQGPRISKLLSVVEILKRLTHDSIDVKITYSFIEEDRIENKDELLFKKLLIPVMYAEIKVKDR